MSHVPAASGNGVIGSEEEADLFELGAALLRWRRRIALLTMVGAVIGASAGLLKRRVYTSTTTFIPQASDNQSASGLAAAASQFGLRIAGPSASWGPAIYVEL